MIHLTHLSWEATRTAGVASIQELRLGREPAAQGPQAVSRSWLEPGYLTPMCGILRRRNLLVRTSNLSI